MNSLSQVQQGHRHESGLVALGSLRLKEFSVVGSASAGTLVVFDTDTAPETGSYAQSGTTVTVTKTNHGLSTGDVVGINFAVGTGGTAQPGNYEITVTTANAFTVTMLNSDTITGTPACQYVSNSGNNQSSPKRWIMSKHTSAADTYANVFQVPNSGFLVRNGVYFLMTNLTEADVFYE
ncbi:MAG: hypothetical protein EBY48_07355 [Opitutae bacterium]|nr:hypothetical protein [Opitutae bacterium]